MPLDIRPVFGMGGPACACSGHHHLFKIGGRTLDSSNYVRDEGYLYIYDVDYCVPIGGEMADGKRHS